MLDVDAQPGLLKTVSNHPGVADRVTHSLRFPCDTPGPSSLCKRRETPRRASAFVRKSGREMLNLSISDRMPLPLERRLTLDVSARVARMVGRASNKEVSHERS